MILTKKIGVREALRKYGGFVRYFDTTEPLEQLAAIASAGPSRDILACCAGGNQVLTMIGAASGIRSLWAVDINPAQLFVLAAKSIELRKKRSLPTFEQILKAYPGKIAAVQKNVRSLRQMKLCHMTTGQIISPPRALMERYALVMDGGMFVDQSVRPRWQSDQSYITKVKRNLDRLYFARMDIFDAPECFKESSLDLIYLSDIYLPEALSFYQMKLVGLVKLLRCKGRIVCYLDPGDDYMGKGISPATLLVKGSRKLGLNVLMNRYARYLVLERIMRK